MLLCAAILHSCPCFFFFFNDTATTEIYTLSLHDALPISRRATRYRDPGPGQHGDPCRRRLGRTRDGHPDLDRKSTRLNSSHANISYAVFCLKKKKHETQSSYPNRRPRHADYILS